MIYLLTIFAFYLPFQLATNIAPGFDLASIRIFALFIFLAWILKSLAQKRLFIPNKIQTLLLLSFLFISILSIFFADNLSWGLRKLFFLLSFFPLYFVLADYLQCHSYEGRNLRNQFKQTINSGSETGMINTVKIIKSLVLSAGIVSLIAIFQFLLQFIIGIDPTLNLWSKIISPFLGAEFSQSVLENSSWLVNVSGKTIMRAIAFFPDPHIFAFYLNIILPFSVALFLKSKKYLFLFISIFILIADLLTFSRGGYVGLFAGLIASIFLIHNQLRNKVSNKKIIIGIIIAIILIAFSPVRNRFISSFDFSEGSNQGRFETWKQSLEVIKNNPLIGVGIGNYPLAIKPSADYREPIYSHNLYFDIAAETGIINAIIFILLIIFSIRSFYKNRKNNLFYYAGIISLATFSIHSLFETSLYSVHILPLLILIIALSSSCHSELVEESN